MLESDGWHQTSALPAGEIAISREALDRVAGI